MPTSSYLVEFSKEQQAQLCLLQGKDLLSIDKLQSNFMPIEMGAKTCGAYERNVQYTIGY